MAKFKYFLTAILLIYFGKGSFGRVSPDFIHVCPGLESECLKKTVQETIPIFVKGVPELGITPLDPIVQDNIALDLPGGLKVELTNGRITGIRKCVVDNVKYENYSGEINLHCNLVIKGKYKAHGNILIVQINGEGDAKVKATNVSLTGRLKFEDRIRNGTVYHDIKHISITHRFVDRVVFDLTNLFKGSPELSEAVLRFLNENWKQVADEFGGPVVETVEGYAIKNIKKFFSVVPKDEIIVYN